MLLLARLSRNLAYVAAFVLAAELAVGLAWPYATGAAVAVAWFAGLSAWIRHTCRRTEINPHETDTP